jgi:general secretion pathway protein E
VENKSPPQHLGSLVISRIKIMARLNTAERRLAQEGRIGMAIRGKEIDMRVATTPTIHGESPSQRRIRSRISSVISITFTPG